MKRFLLLSLIMFIMIGCNKHNIQTPSDIKQDTPSFNNDYLYDEIYEIRDGKEIDLTHTQFETKALYKFSTITSFSQNHCYLGLVINGEELKEGEINELASSSLLKDSIRISFSLPIKSFNIGIHKSSFQDAVTYVVNHKDFIGSQSQSFSYRMKNIRRYNQINIAFGANINLPNIFTLDFDVNNGEVEDKTCLMVDMTQIYFSAYMDFPYDGNIFKTEELRKQYLQYNPVYIGTVNMGRKAVLIAESITSYKDLSVAIRSAFKAKIVNGKLDLDANTINILTNTELQLCIIAPSRHEAYKTILGFKEFEKYIINGGVFSKEAYGLPISFSGIKASNNGLFYNKININ